VGHFLMTLKNPLLMRNLKERYTCTFNGVMILKRKMRLGKEKTRIVSYDYCLQLFPCLFSFLVILFVRSVTILFLHDFGNHFTNHVSLSVSLIVELCTLLLNTLLVV
jgi:hypothetical protein